MSELTGASVFFDIGDTLASVSLSPTGDRIDRLAVYPYVPGVLTALRERGVRLGVLSDPGALPPDEVDRALAAAGLGEFLDPALVRYGPKDSPQVFEQAAAAAGADRVLFVGEDPGERALAVRAGLAVAPHPLLVLPLLEQASPLRYVRVTVPPAMAGAEWRRELGDLPVLPVHVTGEGGTTVWAVTTAAAAAHLDDLGFWVDRLGAEDEPLTSDLYLLRDDRQVRAGPLDPDGNSTAFFAAASARSVLASTAEGLFVAVPADASVEDLHFSGARHGHNLKLVPSPRMVAATTRERAGRASLTGDATAVELSAEEQEVLCAHVRPPELAGHVGRYAGAAPSGPTGGLIESRHIHHPDNAASVATLVADLDRIGGGRLTVRRHRFGHEGRALENVEAELPGRGLDGVVLVTAHLDSPAARSPEYRPGTDPAPGADDDASGLAGVLAAVEAIGALDAALCPSRRCVRFVLSTPRSTASSGAAPTRATRRCWAPRSWRCCRWT